METVNCDVVRAVSLTPELRADAPTGVDGSIGRMSGFFSVHNAWYEVDSAWEGTFLERTAPGFAAESIAEDRDGMRVLFDHGFDSIGNKVLGPIDVLEDRAKGPYYEVPLFDTSYNRDLLPGLRAGVYGASFRFRVTAEEWDDEPKTSRDNPQGLPERTITRAKIMEFGPVTFPASPAASAMVRSTTDAYYERLRHRDQGAYDAAVRAAGRRLPAPRPRPQPQRALDPEDVNMLTQSMAWFTAVDNIVDEAQEALATYLKVPSPDPDDTDDAGRSRPTHLTTGRSSARSTDGGGGTASEPGNGPSARTAEQARHHRLLLMGVIRNG